jgi:hypothetical protein
LIVFSLSFYSKVTRWASPQVRPGGLNPAINGFPLEVFNPMAILWIFFYFRPAYVLARIMSSELTAVVATRWVVIDY